MLKPKREKKCKHCKATFKPYNTTQVVCSPKCALMFAEKQNKRLFDAETRKRKAKLKSRADWLREAQQAFNAFIRVRDHYEPCISCQRHHQGQYHAGHYRTTKAAPQLRFNTYNVFKQCQPCNTHLSGNITEYRINLAKKIGEHRVRQLENNNREARYTIEYAKRIKRIFSKRARLYKKLFRNLD